MGDFDSAIKNAVTYGAKGQWSEAEEHAKTAIKLNKKDERGYQHAAKAAAMLGETDRALKILTLGTARCPDSKLLANVLEKFKQNQEIDKVDKSGKLQSAFEPPSSNKVAEKKEKVIQASPLEQPKTLESVVTLHKNGYDAYKNCHYQQAIDCFRKASQLYKEFPQELKTEKSSMLGIGLARIGLGTYQSLHEVYKTMVPLKSDAFPASYYILAITLHKFNRSKAALEVAELGYKCSRNVDLDWETYYWPSVNEAIQESRRVVLKEKLGELCSILRNMDPPDAVCRLPECLSLSSHFMPSTSIYHSDPDFVGYIMVKCEMKCNIAYHVNCWKHYKEQVSKIEKVSDKDMLGQHCPTEGCRTGKVKWRRSIITKVSVIDQSGDLKTEVEGPPSKDPELPQPVQPDVKKAKPVKKPGDRVFMKPKKVEKVAPVENAQEKAEREKMEKIEEERAERERAEREQAEKDRAERVANASDYYDSDSDDSNYDDEWDMYDSEEEEIPIEELIAMTELARENNFYLKPDVIKSRLDPTLPYYGRDNVDEYKSFLELEGEIGSEERKVSEQKVNLQKIFHDLIEEKGVMLKADLIQHLEELKLCKEPDYFMTDETALPYFLLETTHFCCVSGYIGLAGDMDKVYTAAEAEWENKFHYIFREDDNANSEAGPSAYDDEVVNTEILETDFGKKKKEKIIWKTQEECDEELRQEMQMEYESFLEDLAVHNLKMANDKTKQKVPVEFDERINNISSRDDDDLNVTEEILMQDKLKQSKKKNEIEKSIKKNEVEKSTKESTTEEKKIRETIKVEGEAETYFESDSTEPTEFIEGSDEDIKCHSELSADSPPCATKSFQDQELEKKLKDAEQTILHLQEELDGVSSKKQSETDMINELTKQMRELKKENKQLSREIDAQSSKFKEEKEIIREIAAKDLESRIKQHTALKNQLIKNNETQRTQIEELTKENATLKSSLDAANAQISPLKNQLMGTQRRLIQELETHFNNVSKTYIDSSMRKVSAMYSGMPHLDDHTIPTRKQMLACIDHWEKTITKVNETGVKFKKTLEGYEKTVKSGKIAEKKLTTIQVPSLPAPPEYPLRDMLEKNLKDSGALFKDKSMSSCSSQTELGQVEIDKLLRLQENCEDGPSTSATYNGRYRSGNGSSSPRTGASTPTSVCSVNSYYSDTAMPAPVPVKPVTVVPTSSGVKSKVSGVSKVKDNSIFSRDKIKGKPTPAPTMADALKGSQVPPVPIIPGPSLTASSSSSSIKSKSSSTKSSKKSNYQVLIDELVSNNYHVSETDVRAALQVVRNRNSNKLTGIAKDEIARRVTEVILEFLLQRPAPEEPRCTDEDLARMLAEGPPEGDEEDCCICMDRKSPGDVYLMPCKHSFHPVCLRRWLMEDQCCPMCRQTVNLQGVPAGNSGSNSNTPPEDFPPL